MDRFQGVRSNIGAGFTSYPFLAAGDCRWIEIDYEHIVQYKRRKVAEWQEEGVLPERRIDFFAADLTDAADLERLRRFLMPALSGSPSFILMEGITYYLDMSLLEGLFGMFRELQWGGSAPAFDFWTPLSATHPVFLRFVDFFSRRFGHHRRDFALLDADFARSVPGYEVRKLTDVQELEGVYSETVVLSEYEAILPESYVIMSRTG